MSKDSVQADRTMNTIIAGGVVLMSGIFAVDHFRENKQTVVAHKDGQKTVKHEQPVQSHPLTDTVMMYKDEVTQVVKSPQKASSASYVPFTQEFDSVREKMPKTKGVAIK